MSKDKKTGLVDHLILAHLMVYNLKEFIMDEDFDREDLAQGASILADLLAKTAAMLAVIEGVEPAEFREIQERCANELRSEIARH